MKRGSAGVGRAAAALAAWSARRARWVLGAALVLAVGAAVGATQISTDAGIGTLVDSDTESYRATEDVKERFGEEPVVVLAEGNLPELILGRNIFRLLRLEGCLSGQVPKGGEALPGPCAELAEMEPVEFVSGPATFLNQAAVQIERQIRNLAARLPASQFQEFLLAVAQQYGITSVPTLDNEEFVATAVFDLARSYGTPKARLAYLFPNAHTAQIVVRLKPDLSDSERSRALRLIEAAVAETEPRRECAERGSARPCFQLRNGRYLVSGAPVVVDGLARALKDALVILFAVAVVVMAAVIALVFRSRLRLLPLALALGAAAITFGASALLGGALTMASIAVLPILIGLAVDYAIQFQARVDESGDVAAAAARGGPTILTACLATAAGFFALQLSPTPMVRDFGLLLIAGIAIALLLTFTAGSAALSRRRTSGGWRADGGPPRRAGAEGTEHRGGDRRERARPPARSRPSALLVDFAIEWRLPILVIAVVLAIIGWALGTRIGSVSDVRELAPSDLAAVQDLNELQDQTGVSGELDVAIESDDLADPAVIAWMAEFKRRVLRDNGFSGENPSCLRAEVCPGPALSDFLLRGGETTTTRRRIEATLGALSPYALRQVAPVDPRTGELEGAALISFGIRAQSLEDQQALIDRVRAEIGTPRERGGPPTGTTVRLAGLPVIAAESASDISASRYWLSLAGILAVALVLLAVYRSLARALVPLVPTVLATGWASLLLWISGIPLNPMSAALGALTIAIATEFGVILSGRFDEEGGSESAGTPGAAEAALRRAYDRTGPAVLASASTAIAGFAVLVVSDIRLLRDFGIVTVIDLGAALLGVMVVLPALLVSLRKR